MAAGSGSVFVSVNSGAFVSLLHVRAERRPDGYDAATGRVQSIHSVNIGGINASRGLGPGLSKPSAMQ